MGQLTAHVVLDGHRAEFIPGRNVARAHQYGPFRAQFAVGVAQALQPPDAGGVGLVQGGGDVGDVAVAEFDHVAGDDRPGAVVVEFHRVHVEAAVAVPDDHHGQAAVDPLHEFRALRHHGEDDPRQIGTRRRVEDADLAFPVPVGGVHERVVAARVRRLLDGLHQRGIIGVEHVGADDEGVAPLEERGPLFGRGRVAEAFGGLAYPAHGFRREGNVGASAEDHRNRGGRKAGFFADVRQGHFVSGAHIVPFFVWCERYRRKGFGLSNRVGVN